MGALDSPLYFVVKLIAYCVWCYVGLRLFQSEARLLPAKAIGFGIFLSATTRTQLLAYQMGALTSFLPSFLLSGFIYSIQNMPRVIQAIALIVPARYFINILRGVFLKGIGLEILWSDFLLLVGYGLAVMFFATRKLRKKVA